MAADQRWTVSGTGHKAPGFETYARQAAIARGLLRAGGSPALVEADDVELLAVLSRAHTLEYLTFLSETNARLPAGALHLPHRWSAPGVRPDTPVHKDTWPEAFEGARVALAAARAVADGEKAAYGLCRPPGHHAGPAWAGGYCYLNNAAIAALTLSSGQHIPGVLDLDFHVGNGTAAILSRARNVPYFSVHASTLLHYPWQNELEGIGAYNCVEFSEPPSADGYLAAVSSMVSKLVDHGVDTLVLSMGFDTVEGDPHGSWCLEPAIYAAIAAVAARPGWPVCVLQEGGYRLEVLTECAEHFGRGLIGPLHPEGRSASRWAS